MSSTRSIWKKAFAASQQLKAQKLVSHNALLDSIPQIASISANNLSRRNAHFTFNPDPTDTSKGKIERYRQKRIQIPYLNSTFSITLFVSFME